MARYIYVTSFKHIFMLLVLKKILRILWKIRIKRRATLNAAKCKAVLPPISRASIRLLSSCNNFLQTYDTIETNWTLNRDNIECNLDEKYVTHFYMSR